MKFNICFPSSACQKRIEMENEWNLHTFSEKYLATVVAADAGCEWKGYVVPVSVGNDKRWLPKRQGVFLHCRVHLLFSKGLSFCKRSRSQDRKAHVCLGCTVGTRQETSHLFRVHCRYQIGCSQLDYKKRKEGYSYTGRYHCASSVVREKELLEPESFSDSLKKMVSTNKLTESL